MNWRMAWRRRLYRLKYGVKRSPRLTRLTRLNFFSRLPFFIFISLIVGSLFLIILFAWYAKDLPRPDKIVCKEGFSTKIYDRNQTLLYDVFANQRRTPVTINQIPQHLQNATIAIEDKNFYKHQGFDFSGIFRAFYNIIVHQKLQGGSTLTQQLVKNALLTQQRTLPRKIKEFILAVQIESKYSKDEILQMYLNESPYGGTAWGVQAASETYFNKNVSDLNLIEAAVLAGLPQRPSVYSPFSDNSSAYIGRTQQVLRRMHEDGYITKEQQEEALSRLSEVKFASSGASLKAPHFVMYVKKVLEDRYGQDAVERGGLKVTTSLDYKLQEETQKAVTEEIAKVEKLKIGNGAAVVIDPKTGEILAMVGSKNYLDPNYDGKVNVALALRQPGSAIKPVTYITAFKKGYTPASVLMDVETVFPVTGQPDYKPVNYDGKFHGPMQLRYALGNSINVPAVKLMALVNLKEMLSTAYQLGLTTLEPTTDNMRRLGLSVTLGGGEVRLLELTGAYSAFANGGYKVEPTAILKVENKDGKVLEEFKNTPGKMVLKPEEAFLISHILSDPASRAITFGSQSALNITDRTIAAKTGTTNDKRDNWTVGWTPQVIVGVWVGNNDNKPMKELASGISGAAPIWRRIVLAALAGKPNLKFEVPDGITTAEVDIVSGYLAHEGFTSRLEYFVKGTEPTGNDPIHQKLKLCRGQNQLATPARVAKGDYDEKEFFIFRETDPVSSDGKNRWQEGIDSWIVSQNNEQYKPPTEYCGNTEEMAVKIKQPGNQQQVGNDFNIEAEVIAANRIVKVEFYIDNTLVDSLTGKPYLKSYNRETGVYTIKVKAYDEKNNSVEAEVKIGINVPWDYSPSPTPTLIPVPTNTPVPTVTPPG